MARYSWYGNFCISGAGALRRIVAVVHSLRGQPLGFGRVVGCGGDGEKSVGTCATADARASVIDQVRNVYLMKAV